MRVTVPFLLVLVLSVIGHSKTIHVPGDFPFIQQAIDAASTGDTVLVHPGAYEENLDFKGKAITVRSEAGPARTSVDGKLNDVVVRFGSGESYDSVLEGFTLFNGTGGVSCYSQSSPTVVRNVITGSINGYGIACQSTSSPRILENAIHGNQSGGIQCKSGSAPEIEGNRIIDNGGFGVTVVDASMATVVGNLIRGHSVHGISFMNMTVSAVRENVIIDSGDPLAGALRITGSSDLDIFSNIVCDNDSIGIKIYRSSNVRIFNNTVQGNSHAGLHCYWTSARVINSIFWNNATSAGSGLEIEWFSFLEISYSNSGGGLQAVSVSGDSQLNWGPRMIDTDPLFVDPQADDYHLVILYPCRGRGDIAEPALPDRDFEGDPTIQYGSADIGADALRSHLYHTGDATPGGVVQLKVAGFPREEVRVWLGSGVMDPPIATKYGDWHLRPPYRAYAALGRIPSSGNLSRVVTIPGSVPSLLLLPTQASVGRELTNLEMIIVR